MDFSNIVTQIKEKMGIESQEEENIAPKQKSNNIALKSLLKLFGKYSLAHEKMLGVEISPHYIRLCQMKNSYGRWSLYQLASSCMEAQFTTMDIRNNPEIYIENLQLLLKKHKINTKDVALSIPASYVVSKIINMPDMEEEDLDEAAAMGAIWESMVQLDGSINEYSVYYQILRRKVRPSKSLAIKPLDSAASGELDGLLSEDDSLDNVLEGDSQNNTTENVDDLLTGDAGTEANASENLDNLLAENSENETPENSDENSLDNILANEEQTDAPSNIATPQTQDPSNTQSVTPPYESAPPTYETNIPATENNITTQTESPALIDSEATETSTEAQIEQTISTEENINDTEEVNIEPTSETSSEIAAEAEPEPEETPDTMDVLFIAAKISDIQVYLDIAKKAGLNPVMVDAQCNVLKHAFDTNPQKDKIPQPYAILEFGPDDNYLYVIDENSITHFPLEISDDDKQLTIYHDNNNEVLDGLFTRYAQQINQTLQHYTDNHPLNHKVTNIYVSSTTPLHVENTSFEPLINNFVRKISELTDSYKVSNCDFCNHIEVPSAFTKKVNAEGNLASWATVVGLATYKLDAFNYNNDNNAVDRVNLLPSSKIIKKNRVIQAVSTMAMVATFAVATLISATSFTIASTKHHMITEHIEELEHVKGKHSEKKQELQRLSVVMGKVKSLDGVRNTIPSNQAHVLNIYKNINKAIPEGVWLADVSFKAPSEVEVQGNSINDQNILEFVNRLNDSGGFVKVSLKTMQAYKKTGQATATAAAGDIAHLKKFTLQGQISLDAIAQNLEILSNEAK